MKAQRTEGWDGSRRVRGLPRIDNRAVRVQGDRAIHRRPRSAPRHPAAHYTVPDKECAGWCIDVILLYLLVLVVFGGLGYFFLTFCI